MKNEQEAQPFDCVKWTREIRDRIYEETKDMSWEERMQWRRARIMSDPFLADLHLNLRRPDGRRGPVDKVGR